MKLILRFTLLLTIGLYFFNQTVQAQNSAFDQEDVIKVAGITTDAQIDALNAAQRQTDFVYFDGLGRPIQSIAAKASPLQNDIVQPMSYNNLGQQNVSYLPYTGTNGSGVIRTTAITEQALFYKNGTADKIADDDNPYNQQVFENSPLQRILSAGTTGAGFQPVTGQHFKVLNYRSNLSTDGNIIKWGPDGINTGNYTYNTLSVSEGTDEDGSKVTTFTDYGGHMILKRQLANTVIAGVSVTNFDTYYIYNNAGTVAYVVPPQATRLIVSNSYALTQTAVSNLIFVFNYDNRGRVVQKKVPGVNPVFIIYDPLNRPVLVQDANLRAANKWNYIKYDGKGRAISQGVYTHNSALDQVSMQAYVSGLTTYNTSWYEGRASASGTGYYSNTVFPIANIEPLAYSYYDDYDLDTNGLPDYTYSNEGLTGTATAFTRGKTTMVRKRSVGSGLSDIWLTSVIFYDKYDHILQIQNNNQLNSTIDDRTTNAVDFAGMVTQSKTKKVTGTSTITVLTTYTYDHRSRLKAIDQQYNTASAIRVAGYEYNELGQLVKKNLHSLTQGTVTADVTLDTSRSVAAPNSSIVVAANSITILPNFTAAYGSTFSATIGQWLQQVDYRYNIKGQVTSINNSKLTNDGVKNGDDNDLFGMELNYHVADPNIGNTASFNGKISALSWMSRDAAGNKSWERSYKYSYDRLNRLTAGNYAERGTTAAGSFSNNIGGFSENNISYNENGNILGLKRNSSTQGTNANIEVDNLTYTYDTNNPNQLNKIQDGSGANYTGYGFRNLTGSSTNYTYDAGGTGNLTADPFKGISNLYNILNKTDRTTVTTVTGRYITYTYEAGGKLLRKRQYDNNVLGTTTDYLDGFVYTTTADTALSYFATPEGRVRNAAGALINEYTLTDPQGNARITFDNSGAGGTAKVIQENSYYAFGLALANSPVALPTVPNKNLYNGGSEWQNDYSNLPDYYQTFYRNYDAAIGRFVAVDPMAESAECMTGYQYAGNNPVMYNDPVGDYVNYATGGRIQAQDYSRGAYAYQPVPITSEWDRRAQESGDVFEGLAKRLLGSVFASQYGATHYQVIRGGGTSYFYDESGNLIDQLPNGSSIDDHNIQTDDFDGLTHHISFVNVVNTLAISEGVANQGGVAQSGFVGGNWKDIGFLANDLTQSFINRNTTLAISEGYNLAKSTVFLPLGLATRTSTGALSALSRTGGLLAKAAPWVAAGSIGINIAVNKQVTAGDVYQSIVTGASLVPGWGLIVGGGALLLEGGSYYFTDKSVSDNINSHLNGGVIYSWK